ncbi:MAG: tetraacyldisaccharide 4'-kinase [Candidatus Omnitrophota bacterium]
MRPAEEYLYNLVTSKTRGPVAASLRFLLFILSFLYAFLVSAAAFFYRLHPARSGCRVISVGNITLGGTGKTCIVEYILSKLISRGLKVGVLSRGYRKVAGKTGAEGMGDEPAMLKDKFPQAAVIVDEDRVRAASRAVSDFGVKAVILDDGMQQWRIFKDLEVTAVDATNPFGNSRIIPAGFLREPLRALRRSDVFILTRVIPGMDISGLAGKLMSINPNALIVESEHKPVGFRDLNNPGVKLGPDGLRGRKALVFSGIGNPSDFENTVRRLGVDVVKALRFPDHHRYSREDLEGISGISQAEGADVLITTGKDAVKLNGFIPGKRGLFSLDVELNITRNEEEFIGRLYKLCVV